MTVSPAHNAIALLIDLAERGEIDPWDVQVIDVIDRFLSELAPACDVVGRESFEAELSHSGQAFLYASMLVLLKADTLARLASPDAAEMSEDGDLTEVEELRNRLPLHLEQQLRRRAVAQPPQQRQVTLDELIDQLKLMAAHLEQREAAGPKKSRAQRLNRQSRTQAARAIAQLAHSENLNEIAAELEIFLTHHWPQIGQGQDWLDLEQLLQLWQYQPPSSTNGFGPESKHNDRVGVFWAPLLLSSQSKVELLQEEFYQDLKVRTLSTPATILEANPPSA